MPLTTIKVTYGNYGNIIKDSNLKGNLERGTGGTIEPKAVGCFSLSFVCLISACASV